MRSPEATITIRWRAANSIGGLVALLVLTAGSVFSSEAGSARVTLPSRKGLFIHRREPITVCQFGKVCYFVLADLASILQRRIPMDTNAFDDRAPRTQ